MPSLPSALNDLRLAARRKIREQAEIWGGTPGSPEPHNAHRDTSELFTKMFNRWGAPPAAAAGVADMLGYGNEAVSALLQAIQGNPVVSKTGWDPEDVYENWVGQDAGAGEDARGPVQQIVGDALANMVGLPQQLPSAPQRRQSAEALSAFLRRLGALHAARR